MSNTTPEHAFIIFPEMMSHPVLFTHPNPKKIAIFGDNDNRIVQEVLKHGNVYEIYHQNKLKPVQDTRIILSAAENIDKNTLDVIINATEATDSMLHNCFQLLHKDGILIQQSESPFDLQQLKTLREQLQNTGFKDLQILCFPQPDFNTGWRTAFMALKHGIFKRVREKIVFNKPFKTQYYNFDIHKAATVLPEFMRNNIF